MRLFFCEMSEGQHSLVTQTPILDSGVLPPRTRRKITIGTVAGFFGGVLVGLDIVKVVGEQASGSSNIALGILLFFAAFSLAILIHEFSHLTAGWLLGFRFSQISVGPIQICLQHGKLKINFLRELTALGFAGMHVDTIVRLRRRFLVYLAAGAAANLITIPIASFFANHTYFAESHPSSLSFVAQLSMISLLLSAVSLLPLPLGPTSFTDGSRIAMLLKDRQRTRRLLSICAVGAQQQDGIRPKKWKQTWLKAASSLPDAGVDDFSGNWLAYISGCARNNEGLAASHLERCLTISRSTTHTVRDLVAQESAVFSAWFRCDASLAERWLNQITRPKLLQPLTRLRLDIATCCARREFEKALGAWDEGLSYVKVLPDTPAKQVLVEGWLDWRKQVEERQLRQTPVGVNE
jgi:hypothetical protein